MPKGVRVRGVVGQFAGLATIYADTLIYEGSDYPTQEPFLVSEMGEETESQVVKLKCVRLIDPSQWTNAFPFFDVAVDYGSGDLTIRIDGNTNIWGTEVPSGTFGVTGIGGQSDGTLPLLDGYTLLPRSLEDLTEGAQAAFTIPDVLELGGDPVFAENESTNADAFQWSFGNGDFSNEEEPALPYDEPGTYNVFLTVLNSNSECTDQSSAVIVVEEQEEDAVRDMDDTRVATYPNPVASLLRVEMPQAADVVIRDASGRDMMRELWPVGTQVLDVSSWATGLYVLEATDPAGAWTATPERFVIQR